LVKRLKKVEEELNGLTKENRMLKKLVENQEGRTEALQV
jgi:hypothetical protein